MNRGIEVLQTFALPLGYGTIFRTEILYHATPDLSMGFGKFFGFLLANSFGFFWGIHRICDIIVGGDKIPLFKSTLFYGNIPFGTNGILRAA